MKRFREQRYLLLGQGFALHELRNLLIEVSMRIRRHRIHVLVLHLLTLLVEVVLSISSLRIDGNPRSHSENPFRLFGLCLLFLVFRKREKEERGGGGSRHSNSERNQISQKEEPIQFSLQQATDRCARISWSKKHKTDDN